MGAFTRSVQLAILSAGRDPLWTEQTAFTGAPTLASAGVNLRNSMRAHFVVDPRAEVHRRRDVVLPAALDLTATYTVTLNGGPVTYDADADGAASLDDVLQGIAGAVNAGSIATAEVVGASVVLRSVGDDYTLAISASGSGELAAVAEPVSCKMRIWVQMKGLDGWRLPTCSGYEVTRRGLGDFLDVPGVRRLYIEVYDVEAPSGDGGSGITYAPARVAVGPCVEETV